jgi:heptosyltransferase-2
MKRIAVWNTAFLGDAVLTLPLIQSLRLRFPEAVIDYYVRGGLEDLFRPHPAIASVYGYDKRGGQRGAAALASLGRRIAGRGYDLWISAHTSFRSACFALLSRAPLRVGYRDPAINRLFYTDCVDRRFDSLHEIERLLRLLQPLGQGPVSDWPELAVSAEDSHRAAELFAPLSGPVLGLHPGSVWGSKRWCASYFAETGARALQNGASVALFAGPGEERVAALVREAMRQKAPERAGAVLDLSGRLSLPLLAACLGRLSCYLTNDSGPMHLAWVQRTPVVAVFGPTVRELGFFPRGRDARVRESALSCRPCGLHGPKVCPLGHHRCMTEVTPDMVWPDVAARLGFGS